MTTLTINRRAAITGIGVTALAATIPAVARADSRIGPDRLWIRRRDTGEELNTPFLFQSEIAQRAAHALYSNFWRDVRDRNQAVWIDLAMLVVFSDLQMALARQYGRERPIDLFSGYRTRERNATIEGAARNSLHIQGKAGDFTVPGLSPRQVADAAEGVRGLGGLGRYPTFTHIDTGARGRRWGSNG